MKTRAMKIQPWHFYTRAKHMLLRRLYNAPVKCVARVTIAKGGDPVSFSAPFDPRRSGFVLPETVRVRVSVAILIFVMNAANALGALFGALCAVLDGEISTSLYSALVVTGLGYWVLSSFRTIVHDVKTDVLSSYRRFLSFRALFLNGWVQKDLTPEQTDIISARKCYEANVGANGWIGAGTWSE